MIAPRQSIAKRGPAKCFEIVLARVVGLWYIKDVMSGMVDTAPRYVVFSFEQPAEDTVTTIQIPDALAEHLHDTPGVDVSRAAVEQIVLAGYLTGRMSRYQVQRMLGFDNRWDAENWLGERGATLHYTEADLDRTSLDRVLGR